MMIREFKLNVKNKIMLYLFLRYPTQKSITEALELSENFTTETYVEGFYPLWLLIIEDETIGLIGHKNDTFCYADNSVCGGYLLSEICNNLNNV
jgi:hypothetical protein